MYEDAAQDRGFVQRVLRSLMLSLRSSGRTHQTLVNCVRGAPSRSPSPAKKKLSLIFKFWIGAFAVA
jgi:hypothetical protein